MSDLPGLLAASAARHTHLCPRQVLGVRAGLAGAAALGLALPRNDKRMLAMVETAGCFVDGIEVATGCTIGHRTLWLWDYGKVAVTFADTESGRALRIAPRLNVRTRALEYSPGEVRHYFAQLHGYQVMPEEELFSVHEVVLRTPPEEVLGRLGIRTACDVCGEEIINGREMASGATVLCRSCGAASYYQIVGPAERVLGEALAVGAEASSEATRLAGGPHRTSS